eukprot:m51a1_g9332 hypothetical protein (346) ;mRNA; r:23676-25003
MEDAPVTSDPATRAAGLDYGRPLLCELVLAAAYRSPGGDTSASVARDLLLNATGGSASASSCLALILEPLARAPLPRFPSAAVVAAVLEALRERFPFWAAYVVPEASAWLAGVMLGSGAIASDEEAAAFARHCLEASADLAMRSSTDDCSTDLPRSMSPAASCEAALRVVLSARHMSVSKALSVAAGIADAVHLPGMLYPDRGDGVSAVDAATAHLQLAVRSNCVWAVTEMLADEAIAVAARPQTTLLLECIVQLCVPEGAAELLAASITTADPCLVEALLSSGNNNVASALLDYLLRLSEARIEVPLGEFALCALERARTLRDAEVLRQSEHWAIAAIAKLKGS